MGAARLALVGSSRVQQLTGTICWPLGDGVALKGIKRRRLLDLRWGKTEVWVGGCQMAVFKSLPSVP